MNCNTQNAKLGTSTEKTLVVGIDVGSEMHPEFGTALKEAEEAGVRVLYLPCRVTRDAIYADSDQKMAKL